MTKKDCLDTLMVLSALESWCYSFTDKQRLPDWLAEDLENSIAKLKAEVLGEQ